MPRSILIIEALLLVPLLMSARIRFKNGEMQRIRSTTTARPAAARTSCPCF